MAEEAIQNTTVEGAGDGTGGATEDQRVPYERFEQVNRKAKEASERATTLERELADLRSQMEERETAGLPELERERKRAEQLEQRAAQAEQRAEEAEQQRVRSQHERIIIAAATKAGLDDPSDALRFPEYVNVDAIEDADAAERALKRLVKAKPRLLKDEDTKLPGQVLKNGDRVTRPGEHPADPLRAADEQAAATMLDEINKLRERGGYQPARPVT